jgi:nucleoside-diphosphate-sugar epimerase
MTDTMRVLLAGASGVFGRHVERALMAAGYEVVGLGRRPGSGIVADLLDRDGLLRAVDGQRADVVVHAATALRKPPVRHRDMVGTDELRTRGTANLLEAAQLLGARRFVAETMVFGYGYGDHGARVLTEDDTYGPPGATRWLERHVAAMRVKEELTFSAPGIEGVALRFGLFYGTGGTEAVVALLRKRMLPVPHDGGRVLPWVNLADAATAVVAAVQRGRPGEAYNIVDDAPMGLHAHLEAVAAAYGTPQPLTVPRWLIPQRTYLGALLSTNMRVANASAARELGWRPAYPTVGDGLRALAGVPT